MKYSLLLIIALLVPYTAQAKTDLTYKVFAGGINAVEAKMSVEKTKSKYKLFFEAKTRGFLGKLAPWSGSFESYGWVIGDKHQPEKHTSVSVWRSEEEKKEFFYKKNGDFDKLQITEDGKKKPRDKLDSKLTDKTVDILAASMNIMSNGVKSNKCEGTSEVFDGKRRFKMIFKDAGAEKLTASKYNIYDGETIKCTVEIEPISGKWHKKPRGWLSIQEQGRLDNSLPTIWFGQVETDGIYVPVKVRVKTNYGVLFMHLKSKNIKSPTS